MIAQQINKPFDDVQHNAICRVLSEVAYLRLRCAGLIEKPATRVGHFQREVLMKITEFDLPPNYVVVLRRENESDIGVFRAYGPGGWEENCVTAVLAGYACWEHSEPAWDQNGEQRWAEEGQR